MLRIAAAAAVALVLLAGAWVFLRRPPADLPPPPPAQRGTAAAEGRREAAATPAAAAPRISITPGQLLTERETAPPPARPQAVPPPATVGVAELPPLLIPVQGIAAADLRDTFEESRGGRRHEAIDIAAARGTPVLAVDDGVVAKLFRSVPGGLTVYQFDRTSRLAYYYAHLDRYADGLREGAALRRGDLIGFVGSTGNARADAPHLHFAVFRLGPERQWWKGVAVNPFAALR